MPTYLVLWPGTNHQRSYITCEKLYVIVQEFVSVGMRHGRRGAEIKWEERKGENLAKVLVFIFFTIMRNYQMAILQPFPAL